MVGLLVLGAANTGSAALFTNFVTEFAPANWAVTYNPNGAAYVFSGDATTLRINGSASTGPSDIILSLQSPHPIHDATVNFHWSLANNGNSGNARAYYIVDSGTPQLLGQGDTSGTVNSISLAAGTSISFELVSSVTGGKTPAAFDVSLFGGDMVPEAGTWLAGVFLLGVGAGEAYRQKRRRAQPARR